MRDYLTSSDVSAGDDILATDHNQLRADIIYNTMPKVFTVSAVSPLGDMHRIPAYTDDMDVIAYGHSTSLLLHDSSSGGDMQNRTITTDTGAGYTIKACAKIGAYVYMLANETAGTTNVVYRYAVADLSAGGTLMTCTGGLGDGTSLIEDMITDGTDLYFNNNGGDTATSLHLWEKWSISGTTLTEVSDIACGATSANFYYSCMDSAGNFFGNNNADHLHRRYAPDGTLDKTQSYQTDVTYGLHSFEGVPYYKKKYQEFTFWKVPLQA